MSDEPNRIMSRMLERLFAAMARGPSLNCRPHNSRQRVDLTQIEKLEDQAPTAAFRHLFTDERGVKLVGRVTQPPPRVSFTSAADQPEPSDEDKRAATAWSAQKALLNKLRVVAEEAKTYEDDTGVYVLNVGFPLLALPPGLLGGGRVLAPCAFVPVTLTVKSGASPSVELACREDDVDRVVPNTALLAWLERQTGTPIADLFEDEDGVDPWREVAEIVRHVCKTLEIDTPPAFTADAWPDELTLEPAPRADEFDARPAIVPAAVVGLFPMSNQGLLRDTQAMTAGEALGGPVEPFLKVNVDVDAPAAEGSAEPNQDAVLEQRDDSPNAAADERFVTLADPCQAQAVRYARACRALVVHGPPGTGKSQTITNVIGDHLARGERVLFVCDKRTALDVVANRLEHLGLGRLCATVHDPQRDQRDLYRAVRERLDNLTDVKTDAHADRKLERIDDELDRLLAELREHYRDLMTDDDGGPTFHQLMGRWLAIDPPPGIALDAELFADATLSDIERRAMDLDDLLRRAEEAAYASNPWRHAAGIALADLLARPMDDVRAALAPCVSAMQHADTTADESIPPYVAEPGVAEQGAARADLAVPLRDTTQKADAQTLRYWADKDAGEIDRAHGRVRASEDSIAALRSTLLDRELMMIVRDDPPKMSEIVRDRRTLAEFIRVKSAWWGFLSFGIKKQGREVLAQWGLPSDVPAAQRLDAFLDGLRHRMIADALVAELTGRENTPEVADDAELDRAIGAHRAAVELLQHVHETPALGAIADRVHAALAEPSTIDTFVTAMERSRQRADSIVAADAQLRGSGLFRSAWVDDVNQALRQGGRINDTAEALDDRLHTLEDVLRVGESLEQLPEALRAGVGAAVAKPVSAQAARAAIERQVLAAEIARSIRTNPRIQSIDAKRLATTFDRCRKLADQKRGVVVDAILHRWVGGQQQRLLVGTGTRMNSDGADLKRRLLMRGKRAMRLRQVIEMGRRIDGGDPLMDMCPVWMASPETVAQVFPREPVFDLVIFDEASQCRLEEALPVLTRARRVVIAGDPKQLPPTRFFESAVVASEEDGEIETDQDLFEMQQSEVEDLLTAALGLEIQQSYLDVHYRSRNADLIEFSNEQFYGSRLQAIPGHPSNLARFAPISLHRADGVYDSGLNPVEADRVVALVDDLLKRADPPSIGIASFNIQQRDLIAEKLDEKASADAAFARRLAKARERQGDGSFEGLFVKNLENVQGDERDHIVISTTYGPNPEGRFYRRFGPLGRAGGGRRLNVLVTRARQEVHLVTSIPPDVYRALPPIPPGQQATGGWLLFAYLQYAERIAELYETARAEDEAAAETSTRVVVHPAKHASTFAEALARRLAGTRGIGSQVHWGNDGFCVDVALAHPNRPDDVTIGLLTDACRFADGYDPVEWDIYRVGILEWQGWTLHRLWTPQFFRDPQGALDAIVREADAALIDEAQAKT